jgi:cytochrome P450
MNAFRDAFHFIFVVREIPVLSHILQALAHMPPSLLSIISSDEGLGAIMKWQAHLLSLLRNTLSGKHKDQSSNQQEHSTIFAEYLTTNIPLSEKTEDKILNDAIMLVGAGFETTGYTLQTATYHILANSSIHQTLKTELASIWSEDPNTIPDWNTLEKLPYLRAVIQESPRMSVGVMSRLQRINHHENMRYGEWEIPKHTPVGMSQCMIHYNPTIFPEPRTFNPERWLQGEKSKQLEKYLVSFSRGARGCLGMQCV